MSTEYNKFEGIGFYDELDKRIDETRVYKFRKVLVYTGSLYEYPESDKDIIRILEFKGTGEKRKFMDVLTEYLNRNLQRLDDILEDNYPISEPCWLYDYIASKNYQLEFEKDDIMLRHKGRSA